MEQNLNAGRSNNFNYSIVKHYGTISEKGNTNKELNLVSYNGAPAKLDIRSWIYSTDNEIKIGKGISLNFEEVEALKELLAKVDLTEAFPIGEKRKF